MVREDLLSDPLTYKKSRNRNVTTTTPPRFDKKQRGKSADRGLNTKPSALSMSSLNNVSSGQNLRNGSGKEPNGGSAGGPPPAPNEEASLYEKLTWAHKYDPRSKEEVILNRRVGFYRFKSDLGAGNFSKVKLAHHQLTKERVAVKIIDKSKLDAKTQKMLNREINIMDSLSHPNLIRLFEVTETISGIHLMMEYALGGELFVRIAESGSYSELEAKPIFAQIASAVQYMHDRHFIHRDLKAENVFFAEKYPVPQKNSQLHPNNNKNGFLQNKKRGSLIQSNIQVKVGDFGFATQVNKIDQHLTTFCGSPPYAAPELFQDDHYVGPSVDIWALGILLYLMVTGAMPFKGATVAELKNAILDGHFAMPDYLSAHCADLIASILKRKSEWRLTLQQIKESEWLNGVDWPEPDHQYRSLPLRVPFESTELTEAEAKTRELIKDIGIDGNLLESHIERGPRSHIIGTFRIAQHKLLISQKYSEENTNLNSSQNSKSWLGRRTSTPVSIRTEKMEKVERKGVIEFNEVDKKTAKKNKKSKLCLIL